MSFSMDHKLLNLVVDHMTASWSCPHRVGTYLQTDGKGQKGKHVLLNGLVLSIFTLNTPDGSS